VTMVLEIAVVGVLSVRNAVDRFVIELIRLVACVINIFSVLT